MRTVLSMPQHGQSYFRLKLLLTLALKVSRRLSVSSLFVSSARIKTCLGAFIGGTIAFGGAGFTDVVAQTTQPPAQPDQPLVASPGITAISGQIVGMDGVGLAGVLVRSGASRTTTDQIGRFLVTYALSGASVLQIDGRHAGAGQSKDYGYYQLRVTAQAGQTTVLPFKSWLPLIDHSNEVTVPSPTTKAVTITSPNAPGFELRIPAGVVVRDVQGNIATHLSLTVTPANHTPVPLPPNANVPEFVVIQPSGACLYDSNGEIGAAQIIYPNYTQALPHARTTLFRYEPDANGWAPYGIGEVSADGLKIIPEPTAVITDFSSAECDPKTRSYVPSPKKIQPLIRSKQP